MKYLFSYVALPVLALLFLWWMAAYLAAQGMHPLFKVLGALLSPLQ